MKKIYNLLITAFILTAFGQMNAQCPIPTLVTASPSSICPGATTSLNATATGAIINWYTSSIGGSLIGSSASAANFTISPATTTTYYAESLGASTATNTFAYTGSSQFFIVPSGVTTLTVIANGAQGGNTSAYSGGLGGRAVSIMTVTPGQVLNIFVGGQGTASVTGGFNGGGNGGASGSGGSGGGGASDIRIGGNSFAERVLVAAGGGGSGTSFTSVGGAGGAGISCVSPFGVGGAFGTGCASGISGSCSGGTAISYGTGGGGGGLNSGGAISGDGSGGAGGAGVLGVGGNGGTLVNGAGGGGGGYYGGAGGQSGSGGCHGGGGGGSSFSNNPSTIFTGGVQAGNGLITIIYPTTCTSISRTAITVTVNSLPNVIITVSGATFGCPTSTLTNLMTASGANTYSWSTGALTPTINPTTTITTVYSVIGTALNGCKNNQSSTILISNPPVFVSSSKNPLCIGEPFATLTASGATTYTWSTASTNAIITVTPATTTNYTLSGTVGTCSASVVFTQSVSACTAIENLDVTDSEISIYPNPNNGILNIEISTNLVSNTSLLIYDALGKIVVNQVLLNEINTININDLDNGIYVYKILDKSNIIKIGKLIKQ